MNANCRDRYVALDRTLDGEHHRKGGANLAQAIAVLYVLAAHANTAPANDEFCRARPSIDRIARLTRLSRRAVFRALRWLEEAAYIYRRPQKQGPSVFTLVLRREEFMNVERSNGRKAAEEWHEGWIAERRDEAQRTGAQEAVSHKGRSRGVPVGALDRSGSPAGDGSTARRGTPPVPPGASDPGGTENKIQVISGTTPEGQRGSVAAAPEHVMADQIDQVKGDGSPIDLEAVRARVRARGTATREEVRVLELAAGGRSTKAVIGNNGNPSGPAVDVSAPGLVNNGATGRVR